MEIETVGKTLDAEAVFGTVEAVKTVSDLFLPVAGTITEVNPALAATPELVNSDPYGEGWLIEVKLAEPDAVDSLLSASEYEQQVG